MYKMTRRAVDRFLKKKWKEIRAYPGLTKQTLFHELYMRLWEYSGKRGSYVSHAPNMGDFMELCFCEKSQYNQRWVFHYTTSPCETAKFVYCVALDLATDELILSKHPKFCCKFTDYIHEEWDWYD